VQSVALVQVFRQSFETQSNPVAQFGVVLHCRQTLLTQ
jgi:hypothetical protein